MLYISTSKWVLVKINFFIFFNFLLNFARKKGEHEETGQVYNLFQEHVEQILVFFSRLRK